MNEKTLFAWILTAALTACNSGAPKEEAPKEPAAEAPANEAPVKGESSTGESSEKEATKEATGPRPLTGPSVNVCALLPKAEAESVLGPLTNGPTPMKPAGTLLGGCSYFAKDLAATVTARPAADYEQILRVSTRDQAGKELRGVGKSATSTKLGVMIQLDKRAYFLIVLAGPQGKMDAATAEKLAKKLKL